MRRHEPTGRSAARIAAEAASAEGADVELDEVEASLQECQPAVGGLQEQAEAVRVAARLEPGGIAGGHVDGLQLLEGRAGLAGGEQEEAQGADDEAGRRQGHGSAMSAGAGRAGTGCGSLAVPM